MPNPQRAQTRQVEKKTPQKSEPVRAAPAPTNTSGDTQLLQAAFDNPDKAPPSVVLMMQRRYGNQAVQRLATGRAFESSSRPATARPNVQWAMPAPRQASFTGEQLARHVDPSANAVNKREPKRTVTLARAPEEEREELPAAESKPKEVKNAELALKRAVAKPEAAELKRKDLVQRAAGSGSFEPGGNFENRLSRTKCGGKPLDSGARSYLEPRFGTSFKDVRVHTDSGAAALNKEVKAQAFTHGRDIYFGAGKYNPGTTGGKHLLAHELTHVGQQTGGVATQRMPDGAPEAAEQIQASLPEPVMVPPVAPPAAPPPPGAPAAPPAAPSTPPSGINPPPSDPRVQTKLTVGAAGDRFELEAERTADRVMSMSTHSGIVNRAQRQAESPEISPSSQPSPTGRGSNGLEPVRRTTEPVIQRKGEPIGIGEHDKEAKLITVTAFKPAFDEFTMTPYPGREVSDPSEDDELSVLDDEDELPPLEIEDEPSPKQKPQSSPPFKPVSLTPPNMYSGLGMGMSMGMSGMMGSPFGMYGMSGFGKPRVDPGNVGMSMAIIMYAMQTYVSRKRIRLQYTGSTAMPFTAVEFPDGITYNLMTHQLGGKGVVIARFDAIGPVRGTAEIVGNQLKITFKSPPHEIIYPRNPGFGPQVTGEVSLDAVFEKDKFTTSNLGGALKVSLPGASVSGPVALSGGRVLDSSGQLQMAWNLTHPVEIANLVKLTGVRATKGGALSVDGEFMPSHLKTQSPQIGFASGSKLTAESTLRKTGQVIDSGNLKLSASGDEFGLSGALKFGSPVRTGKPLEFKIPDSSGQTTSDASELIAVGHEELPVQTLLDKLDALVGVELIPHKTKLDPGTRYNLLTDELNGAGSVFVNMGTWGDLTGNLKIEQNLLDSDLLFTTREFVLPKEPPELMRGKLYGGIHIKDNKLVSSKIGGEGKLNLPRLKLEDKPLRVEAEYKPDTGLSFSAALIEPLKASNLFDIEALTIRYDMQDQRITLSGTAFVTGLESTEPFRAPMSYATDKGLSFSADRINLKLPDLQGVKTEGHFDALSYNAADGFAGEGHLVAKLPVLGESTALLKMEQNKIARATFDFKTDTYQFPQRAPIITGVVKGALQYESGKAFDGSRVDADIKLRARDRNAKPSGARDVTLSGWIEGGELKYKTEVHTPVELAPFVELKSLDVQPTDEGGADGSGQLAIKGIKDAPDEERFTFGDSSSLSDLLKQREFAFGETGKGIWGKATYGFDLYRLFSLRGEVNANLIRGAIATGVLQYDVKSGELRALAEMDVPLLKREHQFAKILYSMPEPYRTPPRPPLKFPPLARAGLFFEGSLNMQAQAGIGPINADADAELRNIDLWNMRADVDPLNLGVEGEVRASLDTGAYVAANAWFLHDKFITVQGGVRMSLPAQIRGPIATKFKGIKYTVGEGLKGPDVRVKQDLVLELKVALNPYLQLMLGDGWFETPLTQLPTIAEYPLLPPKKIAELDLDMANFDPGDDLDMMLIKQLHDLRNAPDAQPKDVSKTEGDERDSVPPPIKPLPQNALAGEASEGPFQLEKLLETVKKPYEDNPTLKAMMAFIALLGKISDALSWPEKQVLAWLADKGILQKLKGSWGKLEGFAKDAMHWTFDSMSALWSLIRGFFELGGDESEGDGESEPSMEDPSLPVSEAPKPYELKLGASHLRVMAKNDGVATISRNRLWDDEAKDGLQLKSGKVKLGSGGALAGGTLQGDIPMGKLGIVENLELLFDADGRISPNFTGAQLKPIDERLQKSLKESEVQSVGGTLENTQSRLWKVAFDFQTHPAPPDIMGAKDLAPQGPKRNMVFEKRDADWVIVGGAVLFKGGSLVYDVQELRQDKDGLTAKGMVRLTLDMLGEAEAQAEIEKDKVKDLTLKFKGEPIKLGGENPWLTMYPAGNIRVADNKFVEAGVRLHGQGKTEYLNKGQPFRFDGGVRFDETWRATFDGKLDEETPVTVMPDAVVIKKLTASRDVDKRFAASGEAEVTLPTYSPFTAAVTYDSTKFAIAAKELPGSTFKELEIGYTKDGWGMGAVAHIEDILGFEKIEAQLFYNQKKYGFHVHSATPTRVPGVETKAELGGLEYDRSSKTYSGAGKIDANVPVIGPMSAGIKVDKSKVTEASFKIKGAQQLSIPEKDPYISGTYGGGFHYKDGQFGGVVSGDMTFGVPGIPNAERPALKFELVSSPGITGFIKKASEKGRINDYLELSALDLKLEKKIVSAWPKAFGGSSGEPTPPKKVAPIRIMGGLVIRDPAMLQRRLQRMKKPITAFSGTGGLKIKTGQNSGTVDLIITNNVLEKAETTIALGERLKDPMWGSVKAAYSGKTGLEFAGSAGMLITEGMAADGTIAYGNRKDKDGEKSLDARLEVTKVLMEGDPVERELMTPISRTASLYALLPPLLTLYGRAGIGLSFVYEANPPLVIKGDVGVQGIDLTNQTFHSADANLSTDGRVSAGLTAKPLLGIGAKVISEEFGSVEGGANFPITAEAATTPKLKTRVLYDETRKPKGHVKLNVPLSFGIKAAMQPYAHVRALYGLVDKKWDLGKTDPIQLMAPREIFNFPIDFGNLEEKKPNDVAPKGESELKAASEGEAKEQEVKGKTEKVESPPEKAGQTPSIGSSLGAMGPFNMRTALDKVKDTFRGVGDSLYAIWDGVKAVTRKVGELAYAAAEKLQQGTQKARDAARALFTEAKKAKDLAMDTVSGFVDWIRDSFKSNALDAEGKVLPARELKDVPFIGKLPIPSFNNAIGVAVWAIWGAGVGTVIFPGIGTLIGSVLGGLVGWWNS